MRRFGDNVADGRGGATAPARRRISSGGPWEPSAGYSRAVVVGETCLVSGTTDAGPGGPSLHPGDAGAQARAAWAIVEGALAEAGFSISDVVRTRMYVVSIDDAPAVAAVHGELFADVRPTNTTVVVAALLDPRWKVEIEVDAVRSGR